MKMSKKNKDIYVRSTWKWWIEESFNFLEGHTTSNRNKWRLRTLLIAATIMGMFDILSLYYKTFLVYPRLSRASSLPDATQILNDYLMFTIDLYHINKYDKDACAAYYKQYTIIDITLNRQPNPEIKNKFVQLLKIFTIIWMINSTVHFTTLLHEFDWLYPLIFVPFHLFVLSKILTTLFLSLHTIRIESRLKMIGDVIEDSCNSAEGFYNVNVLSKSSRLTAQTKHSLEFKLRSKDTAIWNCNYKNLTRLSEFYLILTEQCVQINNMFGIRILLLSLNLTIDMVRFINSLYKYLGVTQFSTSHRNPYTLAAASVTRTLVCVATLFSLVHHCERAYRQTDRILRLCDRVLITGTHEDAVRTPVSELRELVSSRPVSFVVARFFRLEYPVLTAIGATVVSYSIILFQSN